MSGRFIPKYLQIVFVTFYAQLPSLSFIFVAYTNSISIKIQMFLNTLLLICSVIGFKSDIDTLYPFRGHPNFFDKYKILLNNIRTEEITPQNAETEFKAIMHEMRDKYPNTLDDNEHIPMVFPLVGSNVSAVGGRNGNGFYVRNFDLFDQTVSGSHPAHDIFIYDKDHDCIDDRKGHYIDVLSVGNGIVLAVEQNWTDDSIYKGGNYVWVYDIERGGLWYYAHLRQELVIAGQRVRPGDKLGEVGRTGFNAAQRRSDTHLHLMYLELDSTLAPYPFNTYEWLKTAETVYSSNLAEAYHPQKPIVKISQRNWRDFISNSTPAKIPQKLPIYSRLKK